MKAIKKKPSTVAAFVGLFLIVAGASWALFSAIGSKAGLSDEGLTSARSQIEQLPKTEECPLNGKYYTKVERSIWEERRPMGIVIENHLDARPQSGMSRADVIYEAIAEGGITRFLSMFYCGASAEDVTVGPVRSARVYFIDWVAEYSDAPLFVHFGGANNICANAEDPQCQEDGTKLPGKVDPKVMALEHLIDLGWRHSEGNALDGGANVSYPAIKRDQYRLGEEPAAWEHSAIGSTDLLFRLGIERGFGYTGDGGAWNKDFDSWIFVDESPSTNPDATTISFEFWSNKPDYDVSWEYDKDTNAYVRVNGGKPHTDWEYDNEQLTAKNIVIQFIEEEGPVDEELHLYYETEGSGDAMVFQNGTVVEGTWEKPSESERTKFFDGEGKEIPFVRGTIWIEGIPIGNEILYN
ncbi:hypothetical protein A2801_03390 [Candidatus Woesebacteria bacterium RIFCSPHIGHO2_01_FULL_41_10]|uniref:DUF3048 domain-containing protein n=1 Tax=Candidatus Woesebacteria bacterium RIFCSPHIGHO2_01_FULL_41_10 TaxID=1802500 RepID=A0A1F7YPK9_9BACT|nr:MAG: hypothetical protein A2801_03390 [Candidatus Woesebacteria bacterium RIFCSPHIGHO2_01_FULL_41_10]